MYNAAASFSGYRKPFPACTGHWMIQWPELVFLFSCLGSTLIAGAVTCLVHDIIHIAAKIGRVNAVAGQSALTARLRAVMSGSTVVSNIPTDFDVQL